MDLDLDPDLGESLSAEAEQRGFATTEAYVHWLLEHRQSVLQPPGERIEARLEQLEGRIESLTLALEDAGVEQSSVATSSEPAAWFDASRETDTWDDTSSGAAADTATGTPGAEPTPQEPDADAPDDAADQTGFAFGDEADAEAATDESVSEFAYSDDLEPPGESTAEAPEPTSEPEDGADDDEIADAIADIDIDEEEATDTESAEAERANEPDNE
ncbi:hypothetical protein SVXHr_0413 [Halorhabdus sp. SVX81]|uniref:hypothetical protein n=1 Tax=Halorhabdus sp. SVX81 TaxID=2978283 RepID=UPI0023D9CBD4|nr:hypothetical protein [Halorhabdus sp. SVX81]WEL16594.1 hypothetical protein SVXHr_0413 [Halorhabdus sp. SVX81]